MHGDQPRSPTTQPGEAASEADATDTKRVQSLQEIEPFGKSLPTAEAEEEKSNKHEYECRRRRGEEERERRRSQSRYKCNLGKEMRASSRIRCLSRISYSR